MLATTISIMNKRIQRLRFKPHVSLPFFHLTTHPVTPWSVHWVFGKAQVMGTLCWLLYVAVSSLGLQDLEPGETGGQSSGMTQKGDVIS